MNGNTGTFARNRDNESIIQGLGLQSVHHVISFADKPYKTSLRNYEIGACVYVLEKEHTNAWSTR